MSFDQLQQTIFSEAKKEIDAIDNHYDKAFINEQNRIKAKARQIEEEIISQAEQAGQMEARRLHQSAQLKAKTQILAAKQAALNQLLVRTKTVINQWDKDKARQLISALLLFIPKVKGKILPGQSHATVVRELAQQQKIPLAEQTIPTEGGFVFKGKREEINATTSHLLKQLFDRHRSDIAKTLFG